MKYPDISHHHPVNDWEKVKNNCAFLISKATEGRAYVDPTLRTFVENCEKYEIPYWLYTYLDYGNELEQAKHLVNTCTPIVGKHFVGYILDVEGGNLAARVSNALNYINAIGCKTMIYTMYAQYNTYREIIQNRPDHCAWWEARYGKNNGAYSELYPPHPGVDLHQFTSNGVCDGISGRCDLNRIVRKDEEWFTTPLESCTINPETNTPANVDVTLNVLKSGSRCQNVFVLQVLLNIKGYSCGNADGIFGVRTEKAVKRFQGASGLTQDGVVGKSTWTVLLNG